MATAMASGNSDWDRAGGAPQPAAPPEPLADRQRSSQSVHLVRQRDCFLPHGNLAMAPLSGYGSHAPPYDLATAQRQRTNARSVIWRRGRRREPLARRSRPDHRTVPVRLKPPGAPARGTTAPPCRWAGSGRAPRRHAGTEGQSRKPRPNLHRRGIPPRPFLPSSRSPRGRC